MNNNPVNKIKLNFEKQISESKIKNFNKNKSLEDVAQEIESAVDSVLSEGHRTSDLEIEGKLLSTKEMGNEILSKLEL